MIVRMLFLRKKIAEIRHNLCRFGQSSWSTIWFTFTLKIAFKDYPKKSKPIQNFQDELCQIKNGRFGLMTSKIWIIARKKICKILSIGHKLENVIVT